MINLSFPAILFLYYFVLFLLSSFLKKNKTRSIFY
nr:MAG TPA: hypothetical protein [Caudoviricetes sp.]